MMKSTKDPSSDKSTTPDPPQGQRPPFPIVAIGASAGGLEALKLFFEALPPDTGLAFILIQHLDPDKLSLMAEILSRCTDMPVVQASHNALVRPNHVYVVPPAKKLNLRDGRLTLAALPKDKLKSSHAIDEFLHTMATEQGEHTIAIILSGTGADGSVGLKAVKGAGGMVMVQEPGEAGYDGMPSSAIATGLVDFVLSARAMPDELIQYVNHLYSPEQAAAALPPAEEEAQVTAILALLATSQAIDCSGYKRGTLVRRIERRMGIHHLRDIRDYRRLLAGNGEELAALAKDLRIVVTGFFRDPEAFSLLQEKVIVPLCQQATPERPIRVWVAGCATGEEAYSIAILIREELDRAHKVDCTLQLLATDIDPDALQLARTGIYPATIEADVSEERLSRFFERHDKGYRVRDFLRAPLIFSAQDLILDTPFSRLDLITCRNLLIYLKPETQRRIFSLFHFALNPNGVIFLGSAENIGRGNDLFRPLDKKCRIFKKIDTVRVPLTYIPRLPGKGPLAAARDKEVKRGGNLKALAERQLLEHFAPCGVVVNQAAEILQFIGRTNLYLQLPEGPPTTNLLAMVPQVIRTALRGLLQGVIDGKEPQPSLLVRLPDHEGRPFRHVKVSARRLQDEGVEEELILVAFSDLPECTTPLQVENVEGCATHARVIRQLEEELLRSREDLESTIEQMEIANEELTASNEEAMSINEEFQSTNEELETSKEELQSMNEELTTVNVELQEKVAELEEINNDLDNLLACSDVGFLFLDQELRIKRFTPAIQRLFHIIQADIGRPLADFGSIIAIFPLISEAEKVLQSLIPSEQEVQAADGRWYLQRVVPYRTRTNYIQGVLITLPEITLIKEKAAETNRQASLLQLMNDTLPVRLAYIDRDERYRYVNDTYRRWFDLRADQILGHTVREIVGPTIHAALQPRMQQVLAGEAVNFEGTFDYKTQGQRSIQVNYTPHRDQQGEVLGFFVLLQDQTERRQAEDTKAWLAAIVESSNDTIISRGFDGTILSWNQGAKRMFGYTAAEALGHKIDILFCPADPEALTDQEILCQGEGEGHCEPCCRTKDGRQFTTLLTQSPIRGMDGKPVGVAVVMSDISARLEMERQVHELNKELENKVAERTAALQSHTAQLKRLAVELTQTEQRERQRLAAVLHDDLQQLLVAAGLRLERLANTEGNAQKQQAIHQVESLLGQAVTATRSLATDLRPPVLNSGNLVKSLHWLADWLWKRFDLTLKFSVAEDIQTDAIPDVDIVFLFDTARELCFNIVKHAHVKEATMLLLPNAQGHLELSIADEGVGTDQRLEDVASTTAGGLGLGSIRDRLALIGGELRIDSATNKGFRVDITLPYPVTAGSRLQEAARRTKPLRLVPDRGESGKVTGQIRVMLVDDHAVVRDGLKMILLDETDIDVVGEAGDGEKALKLARKLLPDVIVMDVNMPKMNGIEATKLIKEEFPAICIIALSINDDQGTNNAMLEAGACAYLNKSGSAEDVCAVVRGCVRKPEKRTPETGEKE